MLIERPKDFERKAQEWAFLHAGAPRRSGGEGSGGATDESLRLQELKMREERAKEDLAKYVFRFARSELFGNNLVQV